MPSISVREAERVHFEAYQGHAWSRTVVSKTALTGATMAFVLYKDGVAVYTSAPALSVGNTTFSIAVPAGSMPQPGIYTYKVVAAGYPAVGVDSILLLGRWVLLASGAAPEAGP